MVVAATENVAGAHNDLHALARQVEKRIAADAYGIGICTKAKALDPQPAPLCSG
jgi:hypothetical protein